MEHVSTKLTGNIGEDRACEYLAKKKYTILERNFRQRFGEIDIIALDKEVLVFVEVKTLPGGNIEILEKELNRTKQKKIIKTAKSYLQKNRQYSERLIRFDVLAIDVPGLPDIYHIENAFLE